MTKYCVGITVLNSFEVEADSRSEAEEKVRNLALEDIFDDADYNISYVAEIIDAD